MEVLRATDLRRNFVEPCDVTLLSRFLILTLDLLNKTKLLQHRHQGRLLELFPETKEVNKR